MNRQKQATLIFDSFTTSPAFGVRSGPSVARQVLYSADEVDLDIRIAPADGKWLISGQVLGECGAGELELFGAANSQHTKLDNLGEFALAPVAPGGYRMRVRCGDTEIEVPEFNLRG